MEPHPCDDLPALLQHVLADPAASRRRADRQQLTAFREYIRHCELEWEGWCVRRGRRRTAHVLALFLPGNVTFLMLGEPLGPQQTDDQCRLTAWVTQRLVARRPYYLQSLAEPQAVGRQAALAAAGFRRLTDLQYMQRGVLGPEPGAMFAAPPRGAPPIEWRSYEPQARADFLDVLEQTGRDSQDCPELNSLRPVEATFESHRAAGRFDPRCWELALVEGHPVGCVLSAGVVGTPLSEVVYVGVVPGWRRRGLGRALLARSRHHARVLGAAGQIIVYDVRNAPARQLYERVGFVPLTLYQAWVRSPG